MELPGAIVWPAVDEPAGGLGVPGSRSSPRHEALGANVAPAGICLVGLLVSPARCSQADAARAARPPHAARAAQPPLQAIPGSRHRSPMIKATSDTRRSPGMA